jgi:hypothetical protein
VCTALFSEQTVITSLNSINQLVFLIRRVEFSLRKEANFLNFTLDYSSKC